jgi:heme O synthase-like polyprenyltransferase
MTSLSVLWRFSRSNLLCWVAATGEFEAGTLFLIQFFGSPHIWAIGWFCMTIMRKVSFMLPTGKKKTKAQRYRLFYPFG